MPQPTVLMPSNSSQQQSAPRLSHRGLTWTLALMTLIPATVIAVLWQYMPPVFEGQLEAEITAEGLPPADYYQVRYDLRPPHSGGELVVRNLSDVDWTHLNMQVNRHYQIYDIAPIPAGETRRFRLNSFISRTGARFSLQYNQLFMARIYARRPTRDRATFVQKFDTVPEP